jgi:hypothetical protein
MDMVSLESACAALHPKLIKSYAMEAITSRGADGQIVPEGAPQAFIAEALACTGKRFKSVGHGWDFRLEGRGLVGAALVYNKALIHSAFLPHHRGREGGHHGRHLPQEGVPRVISTGFCGPGGEAGSPPFAPGPGPSKRIGKGKVKS